ncbi:DUF4476 domain-containing protein [Flaviaesturariibacter amylovorans]|uniref:DUF4476 domain-containing protein n=1 Tax=Flaviaesturariibacter amylovorans TaxID=1084520 RepID=A0ABP8HT08_9BACT
MKAIFTLLFATIFTSAFAYNEGRLSITLANGRDLQVQIDNRNYTLYDNSVDIEGIAPGQHTLRVLRYGRRGGGRNNRPVVVLQTTIYVRPNMHLDVMVNRFGRMYTDERPAGTRWEQDDQWNGGNGNGGWNPGGGDPYGYRQAMTDTEFSGLLAQVKKEWFSSGKQTVVREALVRNYVTVAQVRQLLQQFSFDSERLEAAKVAYDRTVDQRNFYQLLDVFDSQGTKDQLAQFLRDKR